MESVIEFELAKQTCAEIRTTILMRIIEDRRTDEIWDKLMESEEREEV